jgi:hypothetical protein
VKTVSSLKKQLWKLFAVYIKNRDNWTCVTCGKRAEGQAMNAGHYIAKGACTLEYYFDERNVHAQCVTCNLKLEGNRPAYRLFILERYGQDVLSELETKYSRTFKGDAHMWLLDKINHYGKSKTKTESRGR